jgi:hypothetical protein
VNDFIIDRLTNSILNRISGDSFMTEVSLLSIRELKGLTRKKGWLFDWKKEINGPGKEVYKLNILNNPQIIQGLLSLTPKDGHVYINLLESAPFNRGEQKLYEGVAGNLVAFACRLSFQRGLDGFVAFHSKTRLVDHYIKTLGAKHYGASLMVIESDSAEVLVKKYFKQ